MEQDGCRSRIVKSLTSNDDDDRPFSVTTMADPTNDDNPTLTPRDDEALQPLPPTPPSPEEFEGSGEKTPVSFEWHVINYARNTRFLQISGARESANVKSRKSPRRQRYVFPCC